MAILSSDAKASGRKNDAAKLRYDLIPPESLEALAQVYTIGGQKYDDHNWLRGINWSRIIAGLMRHLEAWRRGERFDPENGQEHLASVAWAAFTLIQYERYRAEYDDRPWDLKEEWKPVPNHPKFEVSNRGRVRKHGALCNTWDNGNGYQKFGRDIYVHRVVAALFLRPPEADESVNHRNGNPRNNRVENLEWLDASGQNLDIYRKGRRTRPSGNTKAGMIRMRKALKHARKKHAAAKRT